VIGSKKMSRNRLDGLQVLVVGVEALISREVVRELVAEGARVTAAADDRVALSRLQRDLGLYRTTVSLAPIDLTSRAEMHAFADTLQRQERMPHMVVCCCGGEGCPAGLAVALLAPSLMLHVLPLPGSRLGRAVASLHIPTLPALVGRAQGGGLFDPGPGPQRALIGGQVFDFHRDETAADAAPVHRLGARRRGPATSRPAPRRSQRQETP
jgi:hypothetical protein